MSGAQFITSIKWAFFVCLLLDFVSSFDVVPCCCWGTRCVYCSPFNSVLRKFRFGLLNKSICPTEIVGWLLGRACVRVCVFARAHIRVHGNGHVTAYTANEHNGTPLRDQNQIICNQGHFLFLAQIYNNNCRMAPTKIITKSIDKYDLITSSGSGQSLVDSFIQLWSLHLLYL